MSVFVTFGGESGRTRGLFFESSSVREPLGWLVRTERIRDNQGKTR